jgi:hypothetical protein
MAIRKVRQISVFGFLRSQDNLRAKALQLTQKPSCIRRLLVRWTLNSQKATLAELGEKSSLCCYSKTFKSSLVADCTSQPLFFQELMIPNEMLGV